MNLYQASIVLPVGNKLGEGPVWHPYANLLYWVDILKGLIFLYDPSNGALETVAMGHYVSSLVPTRSGRVIATLQHEVVEVDVFTGYRRKLADIEMERSENRCNDAKCDGLGRLWLGTMHVNALPQKGSLFRLNSDLSLTKLLCHLTIANGLGWSPDHRKMYFIDSIDRGVRVYSFDLHSGTISNERICIVTKGEAMPDGMCVDKEGMLWIAFWGGGRVGRYNPVTGEHLADISVPAPHVTSCTFGGADYRTLYITTARENLSLQELEQYPLSGGLFSCNLPVEGSATNCFHMGEGN